MPVHMIETMSRVRIVARELVQEHRPRADGRGSGRGRELSLEDAACVLKMTRHPLSLDQPVGDHDDSFFGEFVEDHREDDPLAEMSQEALKQRIASVLEELNYRDARSCGCGTGWPTATPTRWKRWGRFSRSPANESGKSRPRPYASCNIRCVQGTERLCR